MKKFVYFITEDGQIVQKAQTPFIEATVSSVPDGLLAIVLGENYDSTHYWDFDIKQFINTGDAPSIYHVFDYSLKQWVDKRTLTDIKVQKWEKLKQHRNVLEFGGFSFEGNIYDSDQVSQGRILGAMLAGQSQTWTTADNIVVDLTVAQLQALYVALQVHVAFAHERGRIAREAVQAATTKDQVEAIVF